MDVETFEALGSLIGEVARLADAMERNASAMETTNALALIGSGMMDTSTIQFKAFYSRTMQGILEATGKLHERQAQERATKQ